MTRRSISIYMAATSAIAVVMPGRFVSGIIIAVELFLLMFLGILFKALLYKLNLKNMTETLMLSFIVFLTMLTKQILILLMPTVALQLSFVIYLPAISTYATVFILERKQENLSFAIRKNIPSACFFSLYILGVSLIRDIFGYGTITLPHTVEQAEFVIIHSNNISSASFLATIPGALVLTSMLLAVFLYIEKKLNIIKRSDLFTKEAEK